AVDHQVDLRRRRRDPFLEQRLPEERVDESALSGVELPDYHEQEELVELADRRGERRLIRRRGAEAGEGIPDRGQQIAGFRELSGERRLEDTKHRRSGII